MIRNENTRSAARRRQPDDRIPHPSWRQTITGSDQGAGRVVSARDFWARLDIRHDPEF